MNIAQQTPVLQTPPTTPTAPIIGIYSFTDGPVSLLLQNNLLALDPSHHDIYDSKTLTQLGGNQYGLDQYIKTTTTDSNSIPPRDPSSGALTGTGTDLARPQPTFRASLMTKIQTNQRDRQRTAVVDLRFLMWDERWWARVTTPNSNEPLRWGKGDVNGFTRVIFLDASEREIEGLIAGEKGGGERNAVAVRNMLRIRQRKERLNLRTACLQAGVVFTAVAGWEGGDGGSGSESGSGLDVVRRVGDLTRSAFEPAFESRNTDAILKKVEEEIFAAPFRIETVLVVDADRTLGGDAIGTEFWQRCKTQHTVTPKKVFEAWGQGSWQAAVQVACLFGEIPEETIDEFCDWKVKAWAGHQARNPLRKAFARFLGDVAQAPWVHVVVFTRGSEAVMRRLLEKEGLSQTVTVIGMEPSAMRVVTPQVQRVLVGWLRSRYGVLVWAFGNDVLDVDMMSAADRAFMVAGTENSNTKEAECRDLRAKLREAMNWRRWPPIQVLIPPGYMAGDEQGWVQMDDGFRHEVLQRRYTSEYTTYYPYCGGFGVR